ncbi:phosphate ABC transporter permease PstA [Coleofasciculus sp. FACHB-SPT9]|uniref:phosphate ABC transporter permease PstA n=1 Tax=Cyanophyceae TaxID=3028117 RepID=UPI0016861EA6|nr:phosphate ABC transporter permease PstA [Coleofasciculus sp. FACHB-SPT9]MBD1892010.1 phosphate ABC transporter permease PstA [Coleofasciculus sp. FACHB-SPT9]
MSESFEKTNLQKQKVQEKNNFLPFNCLPSSELLPTAIVWASVALITASLLWLLSNIFVSGIGQISWEFLTTAPRNAGRDGGIAPILISTALIVGVCMAVSIPLGVGTAILLAEFTSNQSILGRLVRLSLDVLAGVPSIVFGLFGNAFFCKTLGMGFSILSGGLTLACMVLPILIRSTQEGFRGVPDDYRRSAAALGLSRTATLWELLLPAAMPGLVVGLLLGLGRAIAETAALIFTSGYVDRMPESLWDSGRSLSVHIYDLAMNVSGGEPNAYASALVLVSFLLLINAAISWLAERFRQSRIWVA